MHYNFGNKKIKELGGATTFLTFHPESGCGGECAGQTAREKDCGYSVDFPNKPDKRALTLSFSISTAFLFPFWW
jgi:hypothetical protein